jgi:hypothetical protein
MARRASRGSSNRSRRLTRLTRCAILLLHPRAAKNASHTVVRLVARVLEDRSTDRVIGTAKVNGFVKSSDP